MNEKKVAVEVAIPLLTILRQLHAMKIIHRCGRNGRSGVAALRGGRCCLWCYISLHHSAPAALACATARDRDKADSACTV